MALPAYGYLVRRLVVAFTAMLTTVMAFSIASLSIGAVNVPVGAILECMVRVSRDATCVIASLRVTRTLASLVAGASLGVAGTLIQGVSRNPLAEPYILGISSTALATTALAILADPSVALSKIQLTTYAFIGALLALTLTLLLSRLGRGDLSIVLAGVAVTALFFGISHVALYLVQARLHIHYVYLLMGSTSSIIWDDVKLMLVAFAAGVTASAALAKPLNTYVYGSDYARQLGYSPRSVAVASAIVACLLTGSVVATVGIVGFVGLAAPHVARSLVGSDHRFTIPASALVGAAVVVLSDIAVRLASRGLGELPLGVMTGILGAPFLAYLVLRRVSRGVSG